MALLSKWLADYRHRILFPYIKGDILDIGCGNAVLYRDFKPLLHSYTGVELSQSRVDQLSKDLPGAVFLKKDLDREFLEIDARFDVIVMLAIIEHIWNQKFLFEQIINLLKPAGKVIITTPTPFGNDIIHVIGSKFGLFAKSAVDDHICIYNKRRFVNLANEFGMRIIHFKRFQFWSNQIAVLERK